MSNKLQVSVEVDSRLDRIEKLVLSAINGQSAMKSELLVKIGSVGKRIDDLELKMDKGFKEVNQKIDKVEKNLTDRLDKIGHFVAYLEDDAPTIEEFDKPELRVKKIEQKLATN
jgi:tetrahydromethanopterin S-methyltransferase subunit G